ncbi:MAG: matrixin family metalloprotease, partial [Cyanobacteria bacterium]|nr:matrixin family metalloprotease [Cyanobacteriota bacterium]
YPEFKTKAGQTIHWLREQMPLQVWVSNGLAIDTIIDPSTKVPFANVDQTGVWPDFVAYLIENKKLSSLPQAQSFQPEHRQAAIEGINLWKRFEKEGIFSFQLTEDPESADVHVFFTHHFVGKTGMALFAKDYKGLTSKRSFHIRDIEAGRTIPFKPVVVLLRTTDITPGEPVLSTPVMKKAAAHEFGHVLGIEEHSHNPNDLMSLYYGNGSISPRDADTIRFLYKLKPDLVP